MLRPIFAINMALLTEGAGMEWPKLETSMNRGVNENVALKSDTIPDNHNPPNSVKRPIITNVCPLGMAQ